MSQRRAKIVRDTKETRIRLWLNLDGRGRVALGDLARVRISEALPHSLRGTLAERPEEAACLSR